MKDKFYNKSVQGSAYQDFTDFSNGKNDWVVSAPIAEKVKITLEGNEEHVLDFPEGLEGTGTLILTKEYKGLAPGDYEFVMRARSVGQINPARISVLARNGKGSRWVINETNFYQECNTAWGSYSGKVVITQNDDPLYIEMNNHNAAPTGNDFRLTKLILRTSEDVTHFKGDNDEDRLNGWVLRPDYKLEFSAREGDDAALYLHTYGIPAGHEGVFLEKTYSSLPKGVTYKFSMRVWLDHASNPPQLEVKCGEHVICPKTKLSSLNKWSELSGEFAVAEELTKITIENHTATAAGNDFLIGELRVSPAK